MIFKIIILIFYFPVYCLPFAIITKIDLGNVNTIFQIILLSYSLLIFVSRIKNVVQLQLKLLVILMVLSVYGFFIGKESLIVKLIAVKFLILPILIASFYLLNEKRFTNFIKLGMYIQIGNAFAVILEFILGPKKLLSLGFIYGTNIRDFTGNIRFPGLTFTNYELGMFSSIIATLMYIYLRENKVWNLEFKRATLSITLMSSIICLLGSSSRSGILFFILNIIFHYLFVKRKLHVIAAGMSLGLALAIYGTSKQIFLFSTQSSSSRFELWGKLLGSRAWIYGTGIGTTGSASNSTFANAIDRTFVDNQFLGVLIQFGLLGALLYATIFFFLLRYSSKFDLNLVMSVLVVSVFIEIYDYTIFMALFYFHIFNRLKRDSEPSKIKII